MASKPTNGYFANPWRVILVSTLVTLVGFNLRTVILAVPPVLPLIQHDLGLSYTETGVLTALPILVLGCCAWPAGLLVGRIGGRHCVTIGLILLSVGTFLRVLWPSIHHALLLYYLAEPRYYHRSNGSTCPCPSLVSPSHRHGRRLI